jgi:GT2 family glycosyltransferase
VIVHDITGLAAPHHQALEILSASALARGDVKAAFRLSDRRCRIRPFPEAHSYVLRAEALRQMGETGAALEDLERACAIAPDDLAANRRLLAWGHAQQKLAAAKALIDCERDPVVLRDAIAVLSEGGQRAVAVLRPCGESVEGWAVWRAGQSVCLSIDDNDGHTDIVLEPDPAHPLVAARRHASAFAIPIKSTGGVQVIKIRYGRQILATLRRAPPETVNRSLAVASTADDTVTVIVPVYADFAATKRCLHNLLSQLRGKKRHCVVIVDDASPDPRIRSLLKGLKIRDGLSVLTNAFNLGFAGAVNRALAEIPAGDIILLNADTVVPPRFIERLAAVARSSADIGTVTPLSNNGEFTSFPLPNQSNPLGSETEIRKLDRIAARANEGVVIDIVNGIGFCLYVTRACLNGVGALSESYHRGYLEDVDFGLRARRIGFRNVCAASIYVGHAGSRSFGEQKRSLVVRNLAVIDERFPAYRTECADFLLADPLNASRQAIEAALSGSHEGGVLLVSCEGAAVDVAAERARRFLIGKTPVLILRLAPGPDGWIGKLCGAAGEAPQSLRFQLTDRKEEGRLLAYLRLQKLDRMEFVSSPIPMTVLKSLSSLSLPYDIFFSDAIDHGQKDRAYGAFWRDFVAQAARVLAFDAQAEAVATAQDWRRAITRLDAAKVIPVRPRRSVRAGVHLGLLPVRGDAQERDVIRDIVTHFKKARSATETTVLGKTLDDVGLMRMADVFVTGDLSPDELQSTIRRLELDHLFICLAKPLFGHPLVAAAGACGLPVGYFDWSRGRGPTRKGDLVLDPSLASIQLCSSLSKWLEGPVS